MIESIARTDRARCAMSAAEDGITIRRVHGPGPRCGQIDLIPAVLVWAEGAGEDETEEASCEPLTARIVAPVQSVKHRAGDTREQERERRRAMLLTGMEIVQERHYLSPPPAPEPLAPLLHDRWTEGDDSEQVRLVAQGELWGPIARIFGKDRGECRERYELVQRHAVAGFRTVGARVGEGRGQ